MNSSHLEWLTILLHTQEAPGSNLGLKTRYPEGFRRFPKALQANVEIVPGPQPFPSKPFPFHHSLNTLSLGATAYVTEQASLNK